MQKILITGGAGFIGSGVLRHLNDKGIHDCVIVDEFDQSDKWKNLVGKQFAELLQKESLFEWLQGREKEIGAIIHLGACSSTVENDFGYLLENNYQYSVRLAEYALKHGIRFIYASSAATYGDGSRGFTDDEELLHELQPLNAYGYSKHLFDLWAKREGVLNKLVGLKYFNVFGPNEYHKGRMASAIFHVFPQAKEKGEIRLFKSNDPKQFKDGEQCRDFIYVKDAARITCSFLENDHGGIYNVGRGEAGTWNQVAHAIFDALEKPSNIRYIEMPQDLAGKYQNYTCADMSKAKAVLGEAAACAPLERSVGEYVSQYLHNQSGVTW